MMVRLENSGELKLRQLNEASKGCLEVRRVASEIVQKIEGWLPGVETSVVLSKLR